LGYSFSKLNASVDKPGEARLPSLNPKQPLSGEVVYIYAKC